VLYDVRRHYTPSNTRLCGWLSSSFAPCGNARMGKPGAFYGSKLRRTELHLRLALPMIAKASPVRSAS
jgi:hypothetical protein